MAELKTEKSILEQIFAQLLFPNIFKTFRLAKHHNKMLIAFLAVLLIFMCGTVMDFIVKPVITDGTNTELDIYMSAPNMLDEFVETNKSGDKRSGVFATMWLYSTRQFELATDSVLNGRFGLAFGYVGNYFKALGWAIKHHVFYSMIFGTIKLLILCVTGGAICRMTALQFSKGEKPGISESLTFSVRKFASFLAAPLFLIVISLVLAGFILLIGLFAYIPYAGEIIVSILTGAALIVGIVIAVVAVGTIAGFNLMFPALSYEGLDCFDAISRSFNYIYLRPWRMALYTFIAAIYGTICYLFVRFFAFLILLGTRLSLSLCLFGKANDKMEEIWPLPIFSNLASTSFLSLSGTKWFSGWIIHLFILAILGLVVSFILSFFFSANTIIYALLRKKVDNIDLDEVCSNPEHTEIEAN